jgi:hypothetical protein
MKQQRCSDKRCVIAMHQLDAKQLGAIVISFSLLPEALWFVVRASTAV